MKKSEWFTESLCPYGEFSATTDPSLIPAHSWFYPGRICQDPKDPGSCQENFKILIKILNERLLKIVLRFAQDFYQDPKRTLSLGSLTNLFHILDRILSRSISSKGKCVKPPDLCRILTGFHIYGILKSSVSRFKLGSCQGSLSQIPAESFAYLGTSLNILEKILTRFSTDSCVILILLLPKGIQKKHTVSWCWTITLSVFDCEHVQFFAEWQQEHLI